VLMDFLEAQGYSIKNFSVFETKDAPAFHDYFEPAINRVSGQTFYSRLSKDLGFHLVTTLKLGFAVRQAEQDLMKFSHQNSKAMDEVVKAIPLDSGGKPRFFYTHLIMPHDPYLFDSDGNFTAPEFYMFPKGNRDTYTAYREYLQYCNNKLLHYIDVILKTSSRPPVIMLMSDHGFRDRTIKEKYHFMTLNAIFFPDKKYDCFYKGMSNVNQFRVLLNDRFKQHLPLLKDSTIFLGWEGM
jgi:hypothetical protein